MDTTEPIKPSSSITFLFSFLQISPPHPESIEMSITTSPNISPSSSTTSLSSTIFSPPASPTLPPIEDNQIENICKNFSKNNFIQCKYLYHQPKSQKNFTPRLGIVPIYTNIENNSQRSTDDYIEKINWDVFKIHNQSTIAISKFDARYQVLLKNLQIDISNMSKFNNSESFNRLVRIYHDTVQQVDPANCHRKVFNYSPSNQRMLCYRFLSQESFNEINASVKIKQEFTFSNEHAGQLEKNFYTDSEFFGDLFVERGIEVHQTDEFKAFSKTDLGKQIMASDICSYIDSFVKPFDEKEYHVYEDHKRTRRGKKKPKPQKKLHSIKDYGLCRVKGSRFKGQKREYTRVKLFKQKYKK